MLVAVALLGVLAHAGPSPLRATQEEQAHESVLLSEQVELARLLDLCSQRLKLNLEYDPTIVRGTITFRFTDAISDADLWVLTNRLLASHGFTTVQMAGEKTLSVVKLSEAAGLARIEDDPLQANAGFVRVIRAVRNRSAKELVAVIQLVLSKPGGSVTHAEGSDYLLIADLKPQVLRALDLLAAIDVPRSSNVVQEVEAKFVPASELVTLVDRVLQTQAGLEAGSAAARVIATPDEKRVLVVAASTQMARVLELLDRFDRKEAQSTTTYVPKSFPVRDVARLIEQVLSGEALGSGAPTYRIIEDDLTGTLLVTATASQHARVESLLARLDSVATSTRRPIRSFKLRNRPVAEVLTLLESLLSAGMLSTEAEDGAQSASKAPVSAEQEHPAAPPPGSVPKEVRETRPSKEPSAGNGARRSGINQATSPELDVSLSSDAGTNTLIAVGDARVLDQIERLLRDLDVRQPQVMLEALALALTESETLDLGVELQKLTVNGDIRGRLSSLFGLGSPDPFGPTLPAPSGAGFSGVVLDQGSFSAIVRALETINHGRTLTIPRVLVNNNQQGRLDSVLQTPFTSTNASNTVATTSFGGTVDAGTTISVRPQIAEGDHLLLEYDVSISNFVGDSVDPSIPPPRQQNKVQSSVTIPDGYTVVVGGLEIDRETRATSRVPWLSELPIVGELFKSRSNTNETTRLYVFIHADVMRGLSFEFLKHISDVAKDDAELDDGTPRVEPRFIR